MSKSNGLLRPEHLRIAFDRKVLKRCQDLLSLLSFESEKYRAAFVFIASDFCRLHEDGKLIDRCRHYYSSKKFEWQGLPDGMTQLSERVAKSVLSLLAESLGKELRVDTDARAKGIASGSLYRLSDSAYQALRLVISEVRVSLPFSMLEFAPRYGDWMNVTERFSHSTSKGIFIRCPVHNDGNERDGSALLNVNGSQAVYCFACERSIGSWREEGGEFYIRLLLTPKTRSLAPAPASVDDEFDFVVGTPTDNAWLESWERLTAISARSAQRLAYLLGKQVNRQTLSQHESTMEVGKAPRNSEGRTLGLKRSVHHYQYDADRISKTPLGPKQSYATHTDLGMQFAAAWKKYESYGDNELSDKYVTKAIDFENARAWQIGLEGGSYTNQDHLVRVSPKKYLEDLCPDTYCSIHYMAHDPNEDHRKVVKLNDGTLVYRHEHTKFHPAAGEWILIDIDHLDLRSHSPVTAEGKEIEAKMIEGFKAALSGHYASRMFSGRGNVVETSKTGMQITLQLSAPMTTAETLHAFYADPAIKAAVMSLGEEMRKVIERGGNVDPAVHNVGRLCRLPGSRIDKQGNYFISRLVAIF